jgi:hypothetical protein
MASAVADRLRTFLGTSGSVTRVERSSTLLVVPSTVDRAEAERLALDVQAIAQEPVAVDGIPIRLAAAVSTEPRAQIDDPGVESDAFGADKRGRIRGVLFSGPHTDH